MFICPGCEKPCAVKEERFLCRNHEAAGGTHRVKAWPYYLPREHRTDHYCQTTNCTHNPATEAREAAKLIEIGASPFSNTAGQAGHTQAQGSMGPTVHFSRRNLGQICGTKYRG